MSVHLATGCNDYALGVHRAYDDMKDLFYISLLVWR
jgi:hypothetical protein